MTEKQKRVLELADLLRAGDWWTTYTAMSVAVYGHKNARQTVGSTMRNYGDKNSAHRVLELGGRISGDWVGEGGGPEEARRRLRAEGIWNEADECARSDRFIDAKGLARLDG